MERGITVCEEWKRDFLAFKRDMGDSYKEGTSLERIDNNKGYEPGNVTWATDSQQAQNRRSNVWLTAPDGTRMVLCEWQRKLGVHYDYMRRKALQMGISRNQLLAIMLSK